MTNTNIKETVNLPKTDFPIRAGLVQKEPEILKYWEDKNIYQKLTKKQKNSSKTYILHDGPPYPNGNIHIGHALNKVLKDIVVRSKSMTGHYSPYVPGWDCHGLPIETQLIKELQKNGMEEKKQDIAWFREQCKEFAMRYVEIQKEEFKRLGVFGEWEKPYLTLNNSYESKVIKLFGEMAENGIVFRGKKPIHWCASCETALAEAELEYQDKKSPSIYIRFKISKPTPKLAEILKNEPESYILVWTTTPWTIPANVAIAAHPQFQYNVLKTDTAIYIMVDALQETLIKKLNLINPVLLGTIKGKDLENLETRHPFIDRASPMILTDYVTAEDGTGFVHTAPGHGNEDYIAGLQYNLPIVMPVDNKGCFTDEVPEWKGVKVFDANKLICEKMHNDGSLLKLEMITHSYPHCWRCKNPVIFRATEQWFISMDTPLKKGGKTLRQKSIEAIKKTNWIPTWGENRILAMIENRPDWCISRQRYWGIPIPVFICSKCGNPEMTGEFNQAVANLVEKEGTVAWFSRKTEEFLPKHLKCSKCQNETFEKEKDILDVWFESGASWGSVLEITDGLRSPSEMYLEGSDQHRGWFHSSLLIAMGTRDEAPYKDVLTHGFIVDEKGQKMSKSVGNVVSPQEVIKEHGADILRWWVAGADFKNDISVGKNILNQSRDTFSKVRNTIRFLLSNLFDFNPENDLIEYDKMNEIDRWILSKLNTIVEKTNESYHNFQYHIIIHSIHDFCAVDLSALYLDMVKDRLYCGAPNSLERRSSQTAIYYILNNILKLVAPILVFTAEDAYSFHNCLNKQESVHLESISENLGIFKQPTLEEKWDKIIEIKNKVYQKLEELRNTKEIKSFLETNVHITTPEIIDFSDWASVFIVSKVTFEKGTNFEIKVTKANGEKCERCWKYVQLNNNLCDRCSAVVNKGL